jgi:hypothetical protein
MGEKVITPKLLLKLMIYLLVSVLHCICFFLSRHKEVIPALASPSFRVVLKGSTLIATFSRIQHRGQI